MHGAALPIIYLMAFAVLVEAIIAYRLCWRIPAFRPHMAAAAMIAIGLCLLMAFLGQSNPTTGSVFLVLLTAGWAAGILALVLAAFSYRISKLFRPRLSRS